MRNAWKSVCSKPWGWVRVTNVPWVVEDACWRKDVEEGVRARTSIGMERREEANMAFIRGMYWLGEAGLVERTRILVWRLTGVEREVDGFVEVVVELRVGLVLVSGVSSVVSLLEWDRARVSAPARAVLGLLSVEGGVLERSRRRASLREEAMVEKGR